MTVTVSKPQLNLREELSALKKKSGQFGEQILRANTADDFYNVATPGRRNLLFNGNFNIWQRSSSVTGATGNAFRTADRWKFETSSSAAWTESRQTDAPTGFAGSLDLTCTTAVASPAASDYFLLSQRLEGQDVLHLKWGTIFAQPVTVSFWVKSNVTGTYTCELSNLAQANRYSGQNYTINTAGVWERKVLTFTGDQAAGPNNNNQEGFRLFMWIMGGSSWKSSSQSVNTWAANDAIRLPLSHANVCSTVNNYWRIAGVQVEVGTVATPFEYRSYGSELALCQRYYELIDTSGYMTVPNISDPNLRQFVTFAVKKRASGASVSILNQSGTATPAITVDTLNTSAVGLVCASSGVNVYKSWGSITVSSEL